MRYGLIELDLFSMWCIDDHQGIGEDYRQYIRTHPSSVSYQESNKDSSLPRLDSKRCPKCGRTLPIESFSKSTRSPSGRQSWCKQCHSNLWKERARIAREQKLKSVTL